MEFMGPMMALAVAPYVFAVFGAAWQFAVTLAVSRSLRKEYRLRGFSGAPGGLRPLGMAQSIVDAPAE